MRSSCSWRASTGAGAPVMGSDPEEVLGKAMTSRIDDSPASSMTMRSKPRPMPPCGGAPYSQRFEEPAERLVDALVAQAERAQDAALQRGVGDAQRARAELDAVQHEVVLRASHAQRVAVEDRPGSRRSAG